MRGAGPKPRHWRYQTLFIQKRGQELYLRPRGARSGHREAFRRQRTNFDDHSQVVLVMKVSLPERDGRFTNVIFGFRIIRMFAV